MLDARLLHAIWRGSIHDMLQGHYNNGAISGALNVRSRGLRHAFLPLGKENGSPFSLLDQAHHHKFAVTRTVYTVY
jgi:hypothetical protein